MADEITTPETPAAPEVPAAGAAPAVPETPAAPAVDNTWAPESFLKDGVLDTGAFRASYDELASLKAQADERAAAVPADGAYELRTPEGFTLPEGVELPKNADGSDMALEFDQKDPDIPSLKQLGIDLGLDQSGMDKILGLWATREARAISEANKVAVEQKRALGPDADSRISHVKRNLEGRLPAAQAAALADGIASADGLRAVEALLMTGQASATTAPGTHDMSNMTPREKIALGMAQRSQRSA